MTRTFQAFSLLERLDYKRDTGSLTSDKISKHLIRCKTPLDSIFCQVDKHFLHSYDSTTNYTRYMRRDKISKPLMRCKSPVDSLLCQVDKQFLYPYDSYDSTTKYAGYMRSDKFPSPLHEMHFLHAYVLTTNYTGSLTSDKISKLFNEMQKSTQQFTLSIGQALSSLLRLVRLDCKLHEIHDKRQNFKVPLMGSKSPLDSLLCQMDKHFLHSYYSYDSTTNYTGFLLPT